MNKLGYTMIKKIFYIFSYLLLCVIIVFTVKYFIEFKKNSLKVNQVWKKTFFEENPFIENEVYYRKVIDIKGNYVLYLEDNDTLSCSKFTFINGESECVENCD